MSIPGSASPLFFGAGAAGAAAAFQIDRSLRFNKADSAYLNKTFSSASNRKTWTWSGWVKRANSDSDHHLFVGDKASSESLSNSTFGRFYIASNGKLYFSAYTTSYRITSALLRDPAAWYHLVAALDTTQSTADDRVKIYINGVQITDFATKNNPSQNDDLGFNTATPHTIGARSRSGTIAHYHDGYLAEVNFVDGQALAASDFGEYDDNNVWQPKDTSGLTFGTNGFRLKFDDNSSAAALGNDSSGNDNDFTANNLSVASGAGNDSLIDTPTNYTAASGNNGGNYCTLSPLKNGQTLSNGNLDVVGTSSWKRSVGTIGMYSGKYYWEYTITASNEHIVGVGPPDMTLGGNLGAGDIPGSGYATETGNVNGTGANGSWSATGGSGAGDVIAIAFDADNGNMYVYKNGTALNSGAASHTGLVMPQVPVVSLNGSSRSGTINFGQRPFAYTPPTGFLSLVTTNLSDPTIADGSTAFDVVLYSGTGSSQTVGSLNFSPDLAWMKQRSGSRDHMIHDTVRGNNNALYPSQNYAEASTSGVTFGSTGFTLGTDSHVNQSSNTYVAWAWDAGTSTVSNTDGSITTNVRASQTNGFSIITYTGNNTSGATIGHGLNAAPEFALFKQRTVTNDWSVYHKFAGANGYVRINTNDAFGTTSGQFNDTHPSASVITLGSDHNANGPSNTQICYAWSPISQYSDFGSYEGNGSADGPFVSLSFRPALIIIKNIDNVGSGYDWFIFDTKRDTFNVAENQLKANLSAAEADSDSIDILSNGFKIRTTANGLNLNSHTHIYAAFAENPQKTARAR